MNLGQPGTGFVPGFRYSSSSFRRAHHFSLTSLSDSHFAQVRINEVVLSRHRKVSILTANKRHNVTLFCYDSRACHGPKSTAQTLKNKLPTGNESGGFNPSTTGTRLTSGRPLRNSSPSLTESFSSPSTFLPSPTTPNAPSTSRPVKTG